MKIGIFHTSKKRNEKRYPIYWEHLRSLTANEISLLYFEEGYPGLENLPQFEQVNFLKRSQLFEICDLLIIPKPEKEDLDCIREGTILFGWPHAVQGKYITQVAIEKKLTLIAWEAMYSWSGCCKKEHIFARNNELAGYAGVNHFMELNGITPGTYGKEIKVAVIGYGSTARGAINSLIGLGAVDITVFSRRSKFQIADSIKNVKFRQYALCNKKVMIDGLHSGVVLCDFDLIINCVLQNPLEPMVFLTKADLEEHSRKMLIIDISCDRGMGFDFAVPTSFDSPIIEDKHYVYYSVDHTPTYYWNSASYEISGALFPFLKHIIDKGTYRGNIVLESAVEIERGLVVNPKILSFQKRDKEYPYTLDITV